MQLKTAYKVARNGIITLALLITIGWLAFVPSAKEPPYQFIAAWGEKGSDPGQFNDPTGIAVAGDEVFVADSRNGRIQVFDFDGHFRRQFGTPGKDSGQLGRPMNLTVHNGELYVAEYFNDRIQVFSLDGAPRRIIGKSGNGPGEFNAPGGVAIAPNGDLLVADFYNQRVQRLKSNGSFVRQWGSTGQIGIWAGEFNYPTNVAISLDGTFLRKWGGPFAMNIFGPFNGWFATVTCVTIDKIGNVFATDFYNHRIQKFSPDGVFLSSFGTKGSGNGQFQHAIAVAVADDGTVFAADFGNNRVEKWHKVK
jgi:DNA-binding beta-propeller fold protein YncE